MSIQITKAMVQQFTDNVTILSQQKGSRLRPYVEIDHMVGEKSFHDQISKTAAQKVEERHGDTPLNETPHARRMVTSYDYDWADLIDTPDKAKLLVDPTGKYAKNAMMAFGRSMDDELIAAATGTAYTGKSGETSTVLPSAQKVAVGTQNLTLAKLLSTKHIFDCADIDPDLPRYIAYTGDQLTGNDGLLNTTEIKDVNYNTVKALAEGKIDTFMGFKFIMCNRMAPLATAPGSAASRKVVAWVEGGLLLNINEEIEVTINTRADKRNAKQVYLCMSIGATRMEEAKVVEISCKES